MFPPLSQLLRASGSTAVVRVGRPVYLSYAIHLCQCCLCPGQPEGHIHGTVQGDSCGEYGTRPPESCQDSSFSVTVAYGRDTKIEGLYLTANDVSLGKRGAAMAVHHALAADLLLINGRILTMDSHNTVAQAVAVRDGKIV